MAPSFLTRDLRIAPNGIYIDPPQPQERAIITHGHADHDDDGDRDVRLTARPIGRTHCQNPKRMIPTVA